jgi:hypothetical protein
VEGDPAATALGARVSDVTVRLLAAPPLAVRLIVYGEEGAFVPITMVPVAAEAVDALNRSENVADEQTLMRTRRARGIPLGSSLGLVETSQSLGYIATACQGGSYGAQDSLLIASAC